MIEELELFIAIAEITGVFIGFGALISVSRPKDLKSSQLTQIRGVVSIGLMVFVSALLPVVLDLYNVADHTLWFVCSLIYLTLNLAGILYGFWESENREFALNQAQTSPTRTIFFWLVLEVIVQVPLILTLIGLFPDLEPAFYATALLFNLFEAVFVLAQIVSAQIEPSDTEHPPHPIHA